MTPEENPVFMGVDPAAGLAEWVIVLRCPYCKIIVKVWDWKTLPESLHFSGFEGEGILCIFGDAPPDFPLERPNDIEHHCSKETL